MQTLGISPKAVLAFLFPLVAAIGAAAANWIATGAFDAGEVRAAAAAVVSAAIAGLGAYLGHPGDVVPAAQVGPPSDQLLAHALEQESGRK
jgi:hypothetical protein